FLQWHIRTHGTVSSVPEPILRNHHNIECRDAVLDWDERKPMVDEEGQPVTRWDGRTTKPNPVTGQEVPDPEARVQAYTYTHPRPAQWPEADYIVGNPPFIGAKLIIEALGEGYAFALRAIHSNVPDSADLVMFWWDKAAELVREGKVKRFGFITTNSLRQTFNRKVVQHHLGQKNPLSLAFAIPDHPWVDSADGAAVRVAMTVGVAGIEVGQLHQKVDERASEQDEAYEVTFTRSTGKIYSDLTIGANLTGVYALQSNGNLGNRGVALFGSGFIVSRDEAASLGYGKDAAVSNRIKEYRNGRDITQSSRDVLVIDLFNLSEVELRAEVPTLYQHVFANVKPERDTNNRESRRKNWWLFGEPNTKLREQLHGLGRYIVTPATSKHRFFTFLDSSILPDDALFTIATDDAYHLGVLSSAVHVHWALRQGAILGPTPRYIKSSCLENFPFPAATEAQQARIRELGEQLDAHRKRQQAQHPELTMTGMYNVLEKLRQLEVVPGQARDDRLDVAPLSPKEKQIYDQGLVGILKQLHDELDAAVAEAYGWP
ncbi:MAG: hypothetical protein KDC03_17080, partial [Flavobacteriales bacterium]|nr:hypothetical protein [Flavobacteriales bacterium]